MTEPITFQARFSEAVKLLVGQEPPEALVTAWIAHDNDDLQAWVGNAGGPWWAQSIAVLDAAQILADQPVEGEPSVCTGRPSALELEEQLRKAENELNTYKTLLEKEHRARVALETQQEGVTKQSASMVDSLDRMVDDLTLVATQARSLGFCVVLAEEDSSSFERTSKQEAHSVVRADDREGSVDPCTCGGSNWENCPHHGKDVLYAEQMEWSAYEREDDA